MEHHTLDTYHIPKDKQFLYINEPWLIDRSLLDYPPKVKPDTASDNIRIYLSIDLNRNAILRRIDHDSAIEDFAHVNTGDICMSGAHVKKEQKIKAGQIVHGYY